MSDWNIQSRGHQCHACNTAFEDGTSYHTVLAYENNEYVRQDICTTCWAQEGDGALSRKGFISTWLGTSEAPPPAPPASPSVSFCMAVMGLRVISHGSHGAQCHCAWLAWRSVSCRMARMVLSVMKHG